MVYLSPSNFTAEEILKYGREEQKTPDLIAQTLYEIEEQLEQESEKSVDRQMERVREQLYFAEELVAAIEAACKEHTRARDLKKAIEAAIENSMFER